MKRTQLAAYLLIVAMGAFGLWRVEDTANEVAVETDLRAAQQCVTSWEVREDIRDAIQKGAEAHRLALLEAFGQFARDPKTLQRFSELYAGTLAEHFQAARAQIPNPDCDLDAARQVLDDG